MKLLFHVWLQGLLALAVAWLFVLSTAQAATTPLTKAELIGIFDERFETRLAALQKLADKPSEATLGILKALANDQLFFDGETIIVQHGQHYINALDNTPLMVRDEAKLQTPVMNNSLREALELMLATTVLFDASDAARLQAIESLLNHPQSAHLETIKRALAAETIDTLKQKLLLLEAMALIVSDDETLWDHAFQRLIANGNTTSVEFLNNIIQQSQSTTTQTLTLKRMLLAKQALKEVQSRRAMGAHMNTLFSGLSLGSVLLLAALGLSITYGLIGVINMAHGEFIMIGAYTTFVIQAVFNRYVPEFSAWYLLAAVPAGFFMAAAVGWLVEYLLLRHLYGRPLETLLATFGLSLVLMQAVRMIFGAQNVLVSNPFWMSGAIMPLQELFPGLQLPYNRLIILFFSLFVMMLAWLMLNKTRLGLFIRATIQNRPMAACVGVPTRRVDSMAFALGTGVAGLGGVALSQIGNVGPDLGQAYIIDSFMVVVLGGVGQLAGTLLGAFGMGILSKFSEPLIGAVLTKIALLILIILFIQKKPSGLFALKTRSVEA